MGALYHKGRRRAQNSRDAWLYSDSDVRMKVGAMRGGVWDHEGLIYFIRTTEKKSWNVALADREGKGVLGEKSVLGFFFFFFHDGDGSYIPSFSLRLSFLRHVTSPVLKNEGGREEGFTGCRGNSFFLWSIFIM